MTTWLILTRAVHLGGCLLSFGVFAFDRLVAASIFKNGKTEAAAYWESFLKMFSVILLPIILLSGIAWFVLVAVTIGGLPLRQTMESKVLETVWNQTEFGAVWKWRQVLWLAGVVVTWLFVFKPGRFQKMLVWIQCSCSGLLLCTLAWAGHGQENSPWHLLADILHLMVAGLWPTGLLPFALLLQKLRGTSGVADWVSISALVRRFSALSLISVALLAVTGFVNAWFLVGSVNNLFEETYGRWLLLKILLFILATAIGAVNLLRLKPRLMADRTPAQTAEKTTAQLQFNVQMELILCTAIVLVVAILGILPPAGH
jgi:putative copper resistance protein D